MPLNTTMLRRFAGAAAMLCAAVAFGPQAVAQETPEEFYKGKVLTILIGHPPGGTYDLYAQLTARHIGKYIPGTPSVVVQGMPGGGGSLAAAHFAAKAPRDGSMIALFPETLAHTQLLNPEESRWDMREMRYLGSFAPASSVMMIRKGAEAQTVEDLYKVETSVACSGRTTASSQAPAIMRYLTGMKLKMVCGYEGGSATILALLRGEVDIAANIWTTWKINHQTEMKAGDIRPLVQFGLRRLADLPDVPTMDELVEDPKAKAAMQLFSAGGDIGRALLTPPEMPDDRFEVLAAAFDKMVADPEFIADAESKGAPLSPVNAKGVQEIVAGIFAASPETVALLGEAMDKGFEN
jgi:tripartite-type tricarboxylate transporter receptor subunit TctC